MGLKDVYEDLKFKAIAKKEAINEWYASEKVQNRISKVKAKLQLAKAQAKKYAAEIEKNEQFKKLRERAAPHLKKIQAKAAELKKAIEDKKAARRLKAERTEDVLSDEEADQALYDYLSDKRREEKKAAAANRGKEKVTGTIYTFAASGDVDRFQKAFEELSEGNTNQNAEGQTVLHIAAQNNRMKILQWLLDNSFFQVDSIDIFGNTALHKASCAGHEEIAKYLVEKAAADLSCQNRSQKTALHYSTQYGHVEVARYLLSKRIDVMAITTDKQTAYDLICVNCRGKDRETKSGKLRETLIQYVELAKEMHIAANSNFAVGTVEYDKAQKKLARINRLLSDHQTWLDSFIEEEVVVEDVGPDLIKAAREGKIQWIDDMLAKENVRIAASDFKEEETGQTLLHIAVLNDNEDFLAILQDSTDLMPDDVDNDGRSCLHLAAMHGLVDMAELVIEQIEDYGDSVDKFIAIEDRYGKKAMDMICTNYVKEDKSTVRAEIEYLLDPNKAQREADEAELIRRYQEQVKLAKYYKAAHVKHPQWIMENKHDINDKLTGLWNARMKREEKRKFIEDRNRRRAKEKAERVGLMTDLKAAVQFGRQTIDESRSKIHNRVKAKSDRLQTVLDGIDKDIENTEFTNLQAQGYMDGISHRMEAYLYPTENTRKIAREEAIQLWKSHIDIGKRAISSLWSQYADRIQKLESVVVESVGKKKVVAKIKAVKMQMESNRKVRKKLVKDLDNSLVIERIFVITERHKMEAAEGKETPRSRRERVRQYKRIKYALDVQERRLLAEKAHLVGNQIVEKKRILKVQFDEANQSTRRRFKRHKQLTWKEAADALKEQYDKWKAYDKETENFRDMLSAEEKILKEKEAPFLWRRAQAERVEELKEQILQREHYSKSYKMVIEDIISKYDQIIWKKEQKFKKRSFKRFKNFKKISNMLRKEYDAVTKDIPKEEKMFDTDNESSSDEDSSKSESDEESTDTDDDSTDEESSEVSSKSVDSDPRESLDKSSNESKNVASEDASSNTKNSSSGSSQDEASSSEDEESEKSSESDLSDVGKL